MQLPFLSACCLLTDRGSTCRVVRDLGGLYDGRRSSDCSAFPTSACSHHRLCGRSTALVVCTCIGSIIILVTERSMRRERLLPPESCCCAHGPRYGPCYTTAAHLFIGRNSNQPAQTYVLDTLVAAVRPRVLSSSWYGSVGPFYALFASRGACGTGDALHLMILLAVAASCCFCCCCSCCCCSAADCCC
jgi:hypothetical protein